MKFKLIKPICSLMAFAVLAMAAYSCTDDEVNSEFIHPTGGETQEEEEEESYLVESITLNYSEYTLAKENPGNTVVLSASVLPQTAEVRTVTWSSSDESVATVDDQGFVTAVDYGVTTIVAMSDEEDSEVFGECEITVEATYVAVTSVTITNTEDTELFVYTAGVDMEAYGQKQLECTFNMYYLSPILDDGTLYEDLTEDEIAALEYEWAETEGEPTVPTNQYLTWMSSDISVVTVQGGLITAMGEGDAWVYATSLENSVAVDSCQVFVFEAPVSAITAITPMEVSQGDVIQLAAVFSPIFATERECTWSYSGDGASVTSAGVLTATTVGGTDDKYVTVKAVSNENTDVSYETTITIIPAVVSSVSISYSSSELTVGDTATVSSSTVLPSYAGDSTITYSSSNEDVATVDAATGEVTAVAEGEVTISATSVNGVVSNIVTFTVAAVPEVLDADPVE